jgi:glycosyltransferase involved in cell wall biosynthesis
VRVAIDCRIAAYTSGGTAVYVRRLVEALAQLAPDELLVLEAARARERLAAGSLSARLFTPSHHRWEQLLLPLELLPRNIDVLHSPDYIPPFVRRCRSVITVHDLAFLRWPEFLTPDSRAYFNGHIRRAVSSADAIIAVSQATKQDLLELLDVPAEKVRMIYEAPGFQAAPGQAREDYVLFAGTFEPRKNLVRLIEAFAQVKQGGYTGKLVLAGQAGWLAEPILESVQRHSAFVEVRQFEPALYARAKLLAFPSLYEGFGLPVLEAMASGTPVLTSNVSSLPEIAGDAALLVDPKDVEAIAEGMWRVLNDGALAAELSRKGLARAAEFSWERAARQTLDVYHSLA